MESNSTLNIYVDPEVLESAEAILSELGIPIATAIAIFLRQVVFLRELPFPVVLPPLERELLIDTQLRAKYDRALNDIDEGNTHSAKEALTQLRSELFSE